MPDIQWVDSPRSVQCRVCGEAGIGSLIAIVSVMGRPTIEALKCAICGSIDLLSEAWPSSSNDAEVDHYVEIGAGIPTIVDALALVDPKRIKRFLDVGCGYGFSLDVGRALYGWDVRGIEPSQAALRGAAELDVDIRHEFLTAESDIGLGYDLIFSSEVIEHVPNPRVFLDAIRQRLAKGGCIILTTPAAEAISPEFPASDVASALSPGFHTFLTSVKGMERLLRDVGFRHVRVIRRHANIRVVASVTGRHWINSPYFDARTDLDGYYLTAARKSEPGSSLSVGMAIRYLRSVVAQGHFSLADEATEIVIDAFEARYGLSLGDPCGLLDLMPDREPIASLAGAAFALGMLEFIHRGNAQKAAEYFELARTTARRTLDVLDPTDLDSVDIIAQSTYHRALSLARIDGLSASFAAIDLDSIDALASTASGLWIPTSQVRVFVDMVAHNTESDATDEFRKTVCSTAARLARSEEMAARTAGLDGLYSLGLSAARAGNTVQSVRWLNECISECATRPSSDDHAQQLSRLCMALIPVSARQPVVDVPLHYMIDLYWCDASGTFLQGWAHCENEPLTSITVSLRNTAVVSTMHNREDLLNFWPECPEAAHGGFRVYIPGRPSDILTLHVATQRGTVTKEIELPDHQIPASFNPDHDTVVQANLKEFIANAPPGPVLALGVRGVSEDDARAQIALFEGREVVGFDIHPGFGIDVVGDAHELATLFPLHHFAIVFSASVFEHVTVPWLVAAQCARVTKIGGLNVHQTPWTWPTHSQPNDFWRISSAGLTHLFSASLGFEVLKVSELGATTVIPQGNWLTQHLGMPTIYSSAGAWIVAKKIDDSADQVSWPYSAEDGLRRAQQYPVDGLANGGS